MRFLNGEERESIAKVIRAFPNRSGGRSNHQLMRRTQMMRLGPGNQIRHVSPERDRLLIRVSRLMNDSISHPPMLIGKVRAWLKYVSEILSAQEGNSPWIKRSRRWSSTCPSELGAIRPA